MKNEENTPRDKMLLMQRESLELMKEEIKKRIGPISKKLRRYYSEYKSEFKHYERFSSKKELLAAVKNSDLVFCGDYHTLQYAQFNALEIIKKAREYHDRLIIGMEMVDMAHQKSIDSFLDGSMTERAFLKSIDYLNRWGFNWDNYRIFFDFAGENEIEIVGLNCSHGNMKNQMRKRDRCAAKRICEIILNNPGAFLFVLYGDLHVAEKHLPARTKTLLDRKSASLETTIIYQNSETLFWELVRRNKFDEIDVVKLRDGVYSIQSVPPWIKLQSYLSWVDHSDELFKTHHYSKLFGSSPSFETVGFGDETAVILKRLQEYLDLPGVDVDGFTVYTLDDLSFIYELDVNRGRFKNLSRLIANNKSLFFPGDNIIYLGNIHLDYAAEEAGEYLYYQFSKYPIESPSTTDSFYRRIISEAIGFFCSKLINPNRKVTQLIDYRQILGGMSNSISRRELEQRKKIAEYVVKHDTLTEEQLLKKTIPRGLKKISSEDIRMHLFISTELGHILGNRLYKMHLKGNLGSDKIIEILTNPLNEKLEGLRFFVRLWKSSEQYRGKNPSSSIF